MTATTIPADSRVPFIHVEFDGSQANQGPSVQPYQLLVVGLRLAAGTVAEKVPTLVTSAAQAAEYFGEGSMLHGMADTLFQNNKSTKAVFLALDDTGAAATGTITVTGTATAAGTLSLYIAGQLVPVAVSSGDAAATVATAIAAAVTARAALPVSATPAAGVVTLTAKQTGTEGNSIDVRLNRFAGEVTPAGIAAAIVAVGGVIAGSGSPTIDSTVWAPLGEEHYNVMAIGLDYAVAATVNAIEAELDDRAAPPRMIEGVACFWASASHSTLITLGDAQNGKYVSAMASSSNDLTPPCRAAAAYAAVVAREGKADPARPMQTLELVGVVAPDPGDQFTFTERDLLLKDGIATARVIGDVVQIERAITNYQENAGGSPDTAFLDVASILTLSYLRWDTRTRFGAKYPRHKIAADGTKFDSGQPVLTPKMIAAEMLGFFQSWEAKGLVEGFAQFKADLSVVRNATDPTRVDIVLSPDLINQLRIVGVSLRFIL
jgi:phage tail sheath gpL-like